MKRILAASVALVLSLFAAKAQTFTLGTNLVDWANYATINLDFGVSVSQHVSLVAGGKFNPWDFSKGENVTYSKNKVGYLGARFWTWNVNSGLWFQVKGQFADYQITGTWRHALDIGQAVGGGLAVGYSFMLSKHFNLELAAGGWGGYLIKHDVYECPDCQVLRPESGPRAFIDLDNISVSFVYVF